MDLDKEREVQFRSDLDESVFPAAQELPAESEAAVMQIFVQDSGANTSTEMHGRQRRLMDDLLRLHESLRSPEVLLDRGNYSRPFPPVYNRRSTY